MEEIKQDVIEEAQVVSDTLNKDTEPVKDIEPVKEADELVCDPADETGCDSCQ